MTLKDTYLLNNHFRILHFRYYLYSEKNAQEIAVNNPNIIHGKAALINSLIILFA